MRGTNEETSSWVWRLRVFIGNDPVTGNPRQATRTLDGTTRQADSALAKIASDLPKGVVTTDHSTVGEFLDRWLVNIARGRSPTTIRDCRGKIKRIKEILGRIRLSKLTAQRLDLAYKAWLDEGLHPASVRRAAAARRPGCPGGGSLLIPG